MTALGLLGGLVERAFEAVADRLLPAAAIPAVPAGPVTSPAPPAPSGRPGPGANIPLRPTTISTSPWQNHPDETPDVPFAVYIGLARS